MMNLKTDFLKSYYFLFLVLFLFGNIEAQSQIDLTSLEFNSVEENIFQRPITSMVLDSKGFLWIGTEGAGLYRYNGFSYTYFKHDIKDDNTISSNSVTSIFVDDSNQLWVGTDAGLCVYDEKQNAFKRFKTDLDTNSQYNYVGILCFAQYEDRFLVGTYDGIKKLNLTNGYLEDYSLSGMSVLDLQFSTKGNLYAATNFGLKLEQYLNKGQFDNMSILGQETNIHVTNLHIDKREKLWVGTLKSGTFKKDLKSAIPTFTKLDIPESATMSITSGIDHIFIAVENEGLVVLDMTGQIVKHYHYNVKDNKGIGSDSVWSILIDDENRIWLGYYENGLGFFDKHYDKFKSIKREDVGNTIFSNDIKAFSKTNDGKIWIAQINGVDILDTKNGKITNVYGLEKSSYKGLKKGLYIEDVFVDSKQNVWLATWGQGIFFLKKGTKNFLNFNTKNTSNILKTDKIRCFSEDGDGNVWIGSFLEGVFYYDSKTETIKIPNSKSYLNSEIINKEIKVIYYDSFGYIWIGTSSGLYYIKNEDDKRHIVTNFNNIISSNFASHPSYKHILDIYETQDGTIWYGTNGGGLFKFERDNQKLERLQLGGKYDLSFVNAIFEPIKEQLWVSSKQGVLKINTTTNKVVEFTVDDGLLQNSLIDRATIQDDNNLFYLGTKNGINTIDPNEIDYNPYLVKPYLKDVKLFNKTIEKKSDNSPLSIKNGENVISLMHDQTVLTIGYEAISFTRSEKNKYAYLLEGFESSWNYVGAKTSATYTNLEPGNYTFRLKASNNDDIWSDGSAILKINVLPPWWKTIWAYILYLLLFSLLVFGITYLYKERVNQKNTFRLERERRKQKAELQNQKLQFFTNISHEFRTPLTLIINPIKDLLDYNEIEFPKAVRQKHNIIHKNAERLSRLINELMDFRKLQSNKLQLKVSQFNIVQNTKSILSFFNEESKRRSIQLDLKHKSSKLDVWADSGLLDKVLFNLLSNALKVTPNRGKIRVKINSGAKKVLPLISKNTPVPVVEISVKDNGPGIDQKDYKKIFDRFYQVSELNKSYYGSTGVGLEMVKSFVKLHKGVIEVESELGKGTVFRVFIPYGKEFFGDNSIVLPDLGKQDILLDSGYIEDSKIYKIEDILSKKELKKKLLIVEDNTDLQDYLVSILDQDYKLILASDGQEGWLKTIEHNPDIVITDVVMPIMDGIEFSKKVKNDSNLSQTPIVMLTAKNLTEDRIKGVEVGVDAYLVKPFETKELKIILEQLLLKKERLYNQNPKVLKVTQEKSEPSLDNDFIQKVLEYIHDNIENSSLNVEKLSSHLCLSRSQVYRKIKKLTGLSPIEFIRRVRLERSRTFFENDKNLNVSEVAHKVGFLSASYFTVCYKKQFGELPKSKNKT